MKPESTFPFLLLIVVVFFGIGRLSFVILKQEQKIQKLQQELDWWKCERQPEQPQPPTLIESN